jgi:putative FmdB family regulatory protein
MPFYEFVCEECGEEFALLLSVKEREGGKVTCPACGSEKTKPLITRFAVITSKKS